MKISTIAAVLFLSPSEAYAAQVGRMRKVKLYSSSSLRRDSELGRDVADPYLGLPDEGHRQLQGSMSMSMSMPIPIASMSMPDSLSMSMPIQVAPTTTAATTTAAATTTVAPTTTAAATTTVAATTTAAATTTESPPTTTAPESSMSYATTTSMSYATTTTTNPTDVVDTTTTATIPVPAPTPFPTNALGLDFNTPAAKDGAPSSAMMMGQSAVVVATVVCAVAGVVALM